MLAPVDHITAVPRYGVNRTNAAVTQRYVSPFHYSADPTLVDTDLPSRLSADRSQPVAGPNQPNLAVDQGGRFLDPAQDTSDIGEHEALPAVDLTDEGRALGAWKHRARPSGSRALAFVRKALFQALPTDLRAT